MITKSGEIIISGDHTTCDGCGDKYNYFIWSFGSDRRYCGKCVDKIHSTHCFIDDAIDLDREQQDVMQEVEAQRLKDYGPRP